MPFRTRNSTQHITLDTRNCEACWECIDACPDRVLGKIDFRWHKHAKISASKNCTGCLACIDACKHGALMKISDKMENQEKKKFNTRAFIAVAMFVAGLALPFSGFMNHKLQMESLTVQRHFWMSVHNFSAILFTIFTIIHISYNWKSLLHHIRSFKNAAISKEALLAIFLVIVIVGLFSSHAFHVR